MRGISGEEPNDKRSNGPADSVITTAIIEDQREVREGLRVLIGGTQGYCCAGAFPSIEDFLARMTGEGPRVILVDIGLPGMSGIEGIPLLRARFPNAALLVLTI